MNGIQTQVNVLQSPAVEGDFASKNPRKVVLAGPGGLVAGPNGVTIGRFAWATAPLDDDGAAATVSNSGFGPVTGFVHRSQQGLNTTYLADAAMTVPVGFPITLFSSGDFWVKNAGAAEAQAGMKAFANLLTGAVTFGAAGSIPGGASATGSAIAQTTLTLVGSVSDNVLTVTSVSAGTVYPGAVLSSNAIGTIVKQLTGTAGGAGTYLLDTGEQTVAAGTTIGGLYGLLTLGTVTGTFTVGMLLTGTNVPANDVTVFLASGAGGTGSTFVVSSTTAVASTTITGSPSIETKWYARSTGLNGELVKISDQVLG